MKSTHLILSVIIAGAICTPGIVFADGGGGGGGDGGGGGLLGAIGGFLDSVFGGGGSNVNAAGESRGYTQSDLDRAPAVGGNVIGTVVGQNSSGQNVVDQTNGRGLVAVAEGGGGDRAPTCTTHSCTSAANACGQTNAGTYQTCSDGSSTSCTASTPANPAGYGQSCSSGTNSCGYQNYGTVQCNGSCSASTPANPANYGKTCVSSANDCGHRDTGAIDCYGQCSATTPANPAGYGTACIRSNACGASQTGTTQCDGSCSASVPSLPAWYGQSCTVSNRCGSATGTFQCDGSCGAVLGSCAPADGTIDADRRLVRNGETTVVSWDTVRTTSCTVVGDNGDSWTGTTGSQVTRALSGRPIYTLTCDGGLSDTIQIYVVPAWGEF